MKVIGGLAQLARAPALHAGGQRFESVILHNSKKYYNNSKRDKYERVFVTLPKFGLQSLNEGIKFLDIL